MILRWLGLFLLNLAAFFLSPFLVFLALPIASRVGDNIWPAWLQWLNTQDDPGPNQGLYEPQVAAVYAWGGWYLKTWYWLGWRNQMYGLFYYLAPTVTSPVEKTVTPNWRVLRLQQDGKSYVCWLNNHTDVGWGWKLFNKDKPTFYLRIRPWKSPSN